MKEKYRITLDIIREYLLTGKYFTLDELKVKIKENHGSMSVSPGYKVQDYLEDLARQHMVKTKEIKYFKGNTKKL